MCSAHDCGASGDVSLPWCRISPPTKQGGLIKGTAADIPCGYTTLLSQKTGNTTWPSHNVTVTQREPSHNVIWHKTWLSHNIAITGHKVTYWKFVSKSDILVHLISNSNKPRISKTLARPSLTQPKWSVWTSHQWIPNEYQWIPY